MGPTKKEISLCKQVTKKHRKEIKKGDWHNDLNVVDGNLDLCDRNAGFYYKYLNENEKIIPLWTIPDCLEFLAERGLWIIGLEQDEDEFSFGFSETDDLGMRTIEVKHRWTDGKTVLEACLKAVLAVLEEVSNGQVDK